ncbi:MAG: enoyl-CoA hydratase/isomerase family protein [Shinella sp.]|nr:enoyl-CoA hydratase/isomerase family protein [Shinella sp.]
MTEHSAGEIILDRIGSAALIRLNRPGALNSINLAMVRTIDGALDRFEKEPGIGCVVLAGEGERGLCAGGDVRVIHDLGKAGDPEATRFWREEFPLNLRIARYGKPYVALMDGITMGGGVGLSAHGRHRIVTERTRLAMPETGIGYFPDVGASWLLPRTPGETGTWLGLTGNEIGAADAIHAGLADACVPSQRLAALVDALGALPPSSDMKDVEATIRAHAVTPGGGVLELNRAAIDRCFRFDTVEEIIDALAREASDFAAGTRETMLRRSPTSLKLALRLLRRGRRSAGLAECLSREFAAASEILHGHDFYEGVRAALIDKDRNPRWSPATLDAVGEAEIERHFAPPPQPLFLL